MKLSHTSALFAAPIPLRIVLALTFIWAGLGKFIHEVPVQGEQAALLANMGHDFANPNPPANPTTSTPAENSTDAEPESTDEPDPALATPPALVAIAAQNDPPHSEGATDQAAEAESAQTQPATPTYTAADFPEPVEVRSLYNLAILTYRAAHPTPDADGNTPAPIWPEWAARDAWPRYMAWAAAGAELAAGLLIAIGLLTRLSAISLAAIMLSAAWLTELGPAIQSGDTLLGFLPNHDIWDIYAWRPLLWQFALFSAALALAFAGPGAIAIDHVSVDRDVDDDDDDDE